MPNVKEVLEFLKRKNQAIAFGSASKNAVQILEKVDLFDQFNAIVDGNHVSKAKPDPEVFLKAAASLHVNPADCVVFEDSVAGIQAANTANMISIGIGDASVLNDADVVFKDFTAMSTEFLEQLITVQKQDLNHV